MASRRSTLRCASCRATYWSDDAHRCPTVKAAVASRAIIDDAKKRPACKTCHAAWGRPCRSKSGHVTRAHRSRVVATVNASNAKMVRDADAVLAKIAAVSRRWRKIHPHEYMLAMGPVAIEVTRWNSAVTSRTGGADVWGWAALLGSTRFLRGHHVGEGAPLAQCQADAIAAVERWRDGIR